MKFKRIAATVLIILGAVFLWRCTVYDEAGRIVREIRQDNDNPAMADILRLLEDAADDP